MASIILLVKFLREEKIKQRPKIDWKGAIAMLLTGTLIMLWLMKGGQSWPWFSFTSSLLLVLILLLIYITIRFEKRAEDPILPSWVWKEPILVGANLAIIGMGVIMIGPNMYLAIFAQSVTGLGAIAAGFILASMSITWPLSSSLAGKLYLRFGFRNTALCGIILVIMGTVAFLFIPFPGLVWMLVSVQLLLGADLGLFPLRCWWVYNLP